MVQFIPVEAIEVSAISDMNKSGYDKLSYEINKSNTFLEKISKSLNQTDEINKSNTFLEKISKSLNQTNEIDKSNTFLEKISKSLNQTNAIHEGQNLASENVTKNLQEIGHSLKQTNALLTDLNASSMINFDLTKRLENMRFQDGIMVAIEASLIGASTVLIGERIISRQIGKRQIKKTHDLINDDLIRIYENINRILLQIELLRSKFKNSQNIQQAIFQAGGVVGPDIAKILVNSRLMHWETIVSGGYLIKLKTPEIRNLQSLYYFLEDIRTNCYNAYTTHTDIIVRICSLAQPTAIPEITTQLQSMAIYFHLTYPAIIQRLHKIRSEINWTQLV